MEIRPRCGLLIVVIIKHNSKKAFNKKPINQVSVTSSIIVIGAASPARAPSLMILV